MKKKNTIARGFLKRFIICFVAYSLLMTGVISALANILKSAALYLKIIVGVLIALLFVTLIIYVEISQKRKEK